MRKLIAASLIMLSSMTSAQTQISKYQPGVTPEGAIYFLPKTALRIVVQVEKTTYTPGDFCKYSERYLRMKNVEQEPYVSYKVTSITPTPFGVADKSKCYAVKYNQKNATANITLADDGTLLAIMPTPDNRKHQQNSSPPPNQKM